MHKQRDQLYSQDSKQLAKSSLGAIFGILLSRASGVIRTIIVNAYFGAGLAMDSFNAAFRLPNNLRDLFADGALSAAFIKALVDAKEKGREEERKLIAIITGFFLFVTLAISILFAIFSYHFMYFISDERFKNSGGLALASDIFKILAFYLPITMLNAIAMASLGVLGNTFRATNGSIFLSVGMILGSLMFAPIFHFYHLNTIYGLVFGAMLGALFQTIYQFIPLIKLNMIPFPSFKIKDWFSYIPLRNVLILMGPRILGQGALTIALLINTKYATSVGQGVLTYIMTAVTIIQVPIGLFGVATSFAALPVLTKTINEKNYNKFSTLLVQSLDSALWLALFTTAAFALFIVPFYQILFQHGKITYYDTIQNSMAVCAYAIGIVFASGSKVILNGFYAVNNTKQIVYNSILYLCISAVLSSQLAPKFGILGLGISYGTSTCLDFFMNLIFFKKVYKNEIGENTPYFTSGPFFYWKIICFTLLAYFISITGYFIIVNYWKFNLHTNTEALLTLFLGGLIYGLISIFIIYFFGPQSLRKILKPKQFNTTKRN